MADQVFTDVPVELEFEVSEMVGDVSQVVRLNQNRVQELLDDYEDDKPQFPILRVTAGEVSGSGNHWPDSILANVAEQINSDEKPGYWGHVKPDDRGYVFPDPETLWLGATVKNESGKPVLYVKGYNIPGGRARRHRSLARVTSWAGKASGRVVSGVRNVEKFVLESIDWARPGSQGMNARVIAFATEMKGGEKDMAEVDLSKVTLEDIKSGNPALFTLMRNQVEAELNVSEMKDAQDQLSERDTLIDKLRKLLKIDDKADIEEAIVTMVEQVDNLGATTLKEKVATYLSEKFKGDDKEKARKTLLRLLPVTEMEGLSDEDLKKKVDETLDSDEEIKEVVTEMIQAPAPLARGTRSGGGDKVGSSGMIAVGATKL